MTSRDRLDERIDHVAARLTAVGDEPAFHARIVSALPERRSWIWRAWMPQLAVLALIVGAAGSWRLPSESQPTLSASSAAPVTAFKAPVVPQFAAVEPVIESRAAARLSNGGGLPADHEYSLEGLSVSTLAAESLVEDGLLSVESLSIGDLELASEFLSPVEE